MATVLAAAYPLVEAVRIIAGNRAVPLYGDNALIDLSARRASDLSQLVGPYSREGFHHPGPVAFYVMAPFVRLLGSGQGGYLAAIVVTGICVTAATVLVWRWCSPAAALFAAAALGVFELCVRVFTLREPWNPYMIVAPMVLLAVLTAGALVGRRGAWAWALVPGSYALQTHISTGPAVVVLLLVPLPFAAARVIRRRRLDRPAIGALVGAAVAVAFWIPSIVELFADHPNNLTLLWDFYRTSHPEPSWHSAFKAAANALAIIPFGNQDYVNDIVRPRWELAVVLAALVVISLIVLVIARRRRRGLPAAFVGVAAVVAVVGTISLKRASGGINAYFATWMVAAPLMVLLGLGVAVLTPVAAEATERGRSAAHRPRAWPGTSWALVGPLAALALAAVIATLVSDLGMTPASRAVLAPQMASGQLAALIESRSPKGTVRLDIESSGAWPQAAGVALALYRHHIPIEVRPKAWTLYFGDQERPAPPVTQQYAFYTAAEAQAESVPAGSVVASTDGVVMATGAPPANVKPDPLP